MCSCLGCGSATTAQPQQHCWGGRGVADVLRCWQGGDGELVAGRDDGGSVCAIVLLGLLGCCWGMRAVAGVGRRVWCCRGRRAAVSGLKREVTINMLLGGACGKAWGWGGHGVHHGRRRNDVPLWQGVGVSGGTLSTMAAIRNNVPCATRSAVLASLQGWKLLYSGEGEVVVTTVAAAVATMPLRWWLQEQALDSALRTGVGG